MIGTSRARQIDSYSLLYNSDCLKVNIDCPNIIQSIKGRICRAFRFCLIYIFIDSTAPHPLYFAGEGDEIVTPRDQVDLPQLLEELHGVPTQLAVDIPPKVCRL